MKRLFLLLVLGITCSVQADIQVDFTRVYMPNAYGSASYLTMWDNAQYAVLNGLSSYGTGISEFKETAEVTGVQSYVTSYESWNGEYAAGEYGGRASWVYHIYDDSGAAVSFNSITKEYFDDKDGVRHSTAGWGQLGITAYNVKSFVGIKSDGSITTDMNDEVVGFIGVSGDSWWHSEGLLADGSAAAKDEYYIRNASSSYWDDRFALLAARGANVEQTQTMWGFEITYGEEVFTAPDITIACTTVPAPGALLLAGFGTACVGRIRRSMR